MRIAPPRPPGTKTAAAVAVTVTLWASAFVGIRAAGASFGAGPLALGRLLVGCLVLGTLVLLRREPFPERAELPLIGVCGVLWFALYNVACARVRRGGDLPGRRRDQSHSRAER